MNQLIYRKQGTAYASAVLCTLEIGQIVIRDGSSVTRLDKTSGVILGVAENCAEEGLELGPVGLDLRAKWLELQAVLSKLQDFHQAQVLDAPDFDPETVGKVVGRQLHVELGRAGHGQGYEFCTKLLERPVTSLALLTLEEAVAVRDAITADENAFLERHYIPEVHLTNPVHKPMRISLDPNQSGIGARARRGLGL